MKTPSLAMYGQPPVAAQNQSAGTGINRAGTGACPYGGKYDPAIHHRRSIRLQGYDYSQAGAYFVTVCTQHRECLFGEIVNGEMRLNDAGIMVQAVWDEIPAHYPGIDVDMFVVMPNHIHGIVVIVGAAPCGRPGLAHSQEGQARGPNGQARGPNGQARGPNGQARGPNGQARGPNGQARGPAPTGLTLPDVVHRFKTITTKRYADFVKQNGWPPFPGKLWQRNYWEHIVRNEPELNRIREYINNNPAQWELDKLFVGTASAKSASPEETEPTVSEESAPYDISRIDFDRLRREFERSPAKRTTVQNLKAVIEQRLLRLLQQNPLRTDFQKHYEEIVAEYNHEKDRVTIEMTFDTLLRFMDEMDDEENRAVREGLDEESLAVFDLLRKPDLTSDDIKRIKAVAVDLLETLKAEKLRINHWRDKESTRDAVRLTIQDYLWSENTGLPETYSEKEVRDKTDAVFVHVFRAYPTVPSPYYASMAS